ncbi:uncharacterized protein ACLA_067180 [Aspergillus clavatus NRRL 1]|uniref:Uncharacterized protein n=1 Tax=Aspergillus clavatus (strain ATCC 1007 / CBS 513.65 / DSM 816 / NCTC 3887 / NRRL 1 / QM 1276 / 107) TaxID=344612 RepID=A1CGK2_ASPCL|nr:uncharacterized protein ACLA_067180 [Aspergillus clavatus NRRL 1]EAW11082.1 hypothetical protein ACLA_067180 [Aspergillus clavatus NRRL 1]
MADMLQEMSEQEIPETNCTRLSECLITNVDLPDSFTQWFSAAAYHTASTAYVITAYADVAIVAYSKSQTVQAANLELCRGVFLQIYENDAGRAARIWERLINTYRGNRSEGEMAAVLRVVSQLLATHYLNQAMEVGVESAEGRRYGEMLELLAQGKAPHLSDTSYSKGINRRDGIQADCFVTNSEVGLIMGNYYQVSGREVEAIAGRMDSSLISGM